MATKKKTDCRQYRIGDFARYLGVTAEFLKALSGERPA